MSKRRERKVVESTPEDEERVKEALHLLALKKQTPLNPYQYAKEILDWRENNAHEEQAPWPWIDWRGNKIRKGSRLIGTIPLEEPLVLEPYVAIGIIKEIDDWAAGGVKLINITLKLVEVDAVNAEVIDNYYIRSLLPLRGWTVIG